MGNYIGDISGMEQSLGNWENYWGTVDRNRQQRWLDREGRTALDRQNREARALSESDIAAYDQRAGLFESADARLAGLNRRPMPTTAARGSLPPGALPEPPANAGMGGNLGPNGENPTRNIQSDSIYPQESTLTPEQRQRLAASRGSATPEPVNIGSLTYHPEQAYAWQEYRAAQRMGANPERIRRAVEGLRAVGLDVVNGQLVRLSDNGSGVGTTTLPWDASSDSAFANRLNQQQGTLSLSEIGDAVAQPSDSTTPQTVVAEGQAGIADPYYQGATDTSTALQPTPEMQMIRATVEDALRRARIYAQHGNTAAAQQQFAQALQGQAAYLQQSRLVMLRSGAEGNMDALANLYATYSGRPEGTVQFTQTGEHQNRFALRYLVRNQDGTEEWVAHGSPMTLQQAVDRAEYLVDRESVMARSEANGEIIRANIAAGAQIRVAEIGAASSQQRLLVDAAIATMTDQRERDLARRGRIVVDSTNNRAWLQYTDEHGDEQYRELNEQEVPVPDTNGNRTETRMTARRINGLNQVTTGGN